MRKGLLLATMALFVSMVLVLPAVAAPGNDDFASAIVLSGAAGRVTGTNIDATLESGEQAPCDGGIHTVWYRWRAPATGRVEWDTSGADFDTVLSAFVGDQVDSLIPVACNDTDITCTIPPCLTSRMQFLAQQGTVYQIQMNGFDETGDFPTMGNFPLHFQQCTISGTKGHDHL